MTTITTQLTAICLFCFASTCCVDAQAAHYPRGVSEEEFFFLLEIGLINETDMYPRDIVLQNVPTQTIRAPQTSSRTNSLSGMDLGSGRIRGVSGMELGSGR